MAVHFLKRILEVLCVHNFRGIPVDDLLACLLIGLFYQSYWYLAMIHKCTCKEHWDDAVKPDIFHTPPLVRGRPLLQLSRG